MEIIDQQTFIEEMVEITNIELPFSSLSDNEISLLILRMIINSNSYISREIIMHKFHISESFFYKIYNIIKEFLEPYGLQLKNNKDKGYYVEGSEKSIRNLISKNKQLDSNHIKKGSNADLSHIYEMIVNIFNDNQYKVTDTFLQNISTHILLMIQRTQKNHFVGKMTSDALNTINVFNTKEYIIANNICSVLLPQYISKKDFENEILFLTHTILGKTTYFEDEILQKEINLFIDHTFLRIKNKFKINFVSSDKLKLYLALHLVPLIYRIKSKTQLKNIMALEIERKFPLANDIALYFSMSFMEHFDLKISKGELSYITLYINYGIESLNLSKSSKKILIITDLRTAETVLIRHKLLSWYPDQIMEIDFIHPENENINLEDYDAVFATDLYHENYRNAITIINLFPTELDFKKINLALNGFTNLDEILSKFSNSRFYTGNLNEKKEVLQTLCDLSIADFEDLDKDFFDAIWSREDLASTYFGDLVALPHPLAPISKETFVSVAILDRPILWDKKEVQIIMLISIEENNPKAFQFWYYLSDIIRNESLVKELIRNKNFDSFINTLKLALSTINFDS